MRNFRKRGPVEGILKFFKGRTNSNPISTLVYEIARGKFAIYKSYKRERAIVSQVLQVTACGDFCLHTVLRWVGASVA
jgi:hypothetical protein